MPTSTNATNKGGQDRFGFFKRKRKTSGVTRWMVKHSVLGTERSVVKIDSIWHYVAKGVLINHCETVTVQRVNELPRPDPRLPTEMNLEKPFWPSL